MSEAKEVVRKLRSGQVTMDGLYCDEIADLIERLAGELAAAERARDEAVAELARVADIVEPHWRGAGQALMPSTWIVQYIAHIGKLLDDAETERDEAVAAYEKHDAENCRLRAEIKGLELQLAAGDQPGRPDSPAAAAADPKRSE